MGSADARIDRIYQRIYSVFSALKVGWQRNIGLLICMLALAHLQLPPCKVCLSLNVGVETHILVEMKDSNVIPENRVLYTGTYNLSP